MNVIPRDDEQRRIAATRLDQNIIVLAGAGTGKTRLLIDRMTLLICGKEIPVDRTVALTFTKKAGEEMRERLEERLRRIADGTEIPPLLEEFFSRNKSEWPRLARKALDDIPKAQIGTIHSFAGHLLRLYPMQAGVDPNFREDEGTLFDSVFEKEWIRWLKEELGLKSPRMTFWRELLREVELSDLKTMAKSLASPHIQLEALDAPIGVTDVAQAIEKEWRNISSRFEFPSAQKAPAFHAGVQALEAALQAARQGEKMPTELDHEMRTFKSPPQSLKEASESLKRIYQRTVAMGSVDEKLISSAKTAVLPFVHRLREELSRKGVVSFDGLLVLARNLVLEHADVRDALKKRFDTFLVDEFQDTDPVQGEILFALSEDAHNRLEPGRLFVVGDPKQSIYRFRGAEIAAFEAFHQRLVKEGAVEATLTDNFRSVPGVIDFANHVFPFVMKEEPYMQPPYIPLQAARPAEATIPVELVSAIKEGGGPLGADEARETEAEYIGDWIETYVKTGKKLSDIAILLRSSNAFFPYLEALRRRNLAYLVEGEKSFYLTSEIVDFLNLIATVADPADTLALVGVLRSPVGGLTDGEILDLKQKNQLDYRTKVTIHVPKTEPLYSLLRQFHQRSSTLSVPVLIHELLGQSGLMELTVASSYGEQAIANLQKLEYLAKKWQQETPLTLKSFARRLRNYRDEERKEGENPLADSSYEAVKLLTVHKAKGLEFPVVFLPNLTGGLNRGLMKPELLRDWKTGRVGLRLTKAKRINAAMLLLEEDLARREDAEEVRVFFVATTRAKNQMVLLRAQTRDSGRFSSYLKSAEPLGVPAKTIEWDEKKLTNAAGASIALSTDWNPNTLAPSFLAREKEYERISHESTVKTPSKMAHEPEKIRPRDDEREERSSNAILIGQICHKILEEWDFSIPTKSISGELSKKLDRAARLFELIPNSRQHTEALAQARTILEKFLGSKEYQRLASVKIIGREVPFCYAVGEQSDGPQLVRGVIDLLYEDQGKVIVADYKTNKLEKGGTAALVELYRPQGVAYQKGIIQSLGQKPEFELIFLRESSSTRI